MEDLVFIKRALVSVSDKTKLDYLVKELHEKGVELIASGGTASFIKSLGIPVTPMKEVTGNPEAFSGRMKTLSFQVSSSLLFRRNCPDDREEASRLGIKAIDLVICNLYPFEKVANEKGDEQDLLENIDIGGPTMIRASAKNFQGVAVCTHFDQYEHLVEVLKKFKGAVPYQFRKDMALAAFRHTANYDGIIAGELEERWENELKTISLSPSRATLLRYGENPHQKAWVYKHPLRKGLASQKPIQGKEISYNNFLDADAALKTTSDLCILGLSEAVSIVKHSNPCGSAVGRNSLDTLKLAWDGDPVSSFGSIICFSGHVEVEVALWLKKKFVEVIIAPSFSKDALGVFSEKKNLRIIEYGPEQEKDYCVKSISGGWLVQTKDIELDSEFKNVTKKEFPEDMKKLTEFGLLATKHLKSNAIGLVYKNSNGMALAGGGMGNPNRLISLKEAVEKAQENGHKDLSSMVLISDAFFPFRDNIDLAAKYGIQYIVQPGGSLRDNEVIKACDELGISMLMTGKRHFRH